MCFHGIPRMLENALVYRHFFPLCKICPPHESANKWVLYGVFANRQFLGRRPGGRWIQGSFFGDVINSTQTSVSSSAAPSRAFWATSFEGFPFDRGDCKRRDAFAIRLFQKPSLLRQKGRKSYVRVGSKATRFAEVGLDSLCVHFSLRQNQ